MSDTNVKGTLNKEGQWQDANGNLLSNEVTKGWDKGKNVKYPKGAQNQAAQKKVAK